MNSSDITMLADIASPNLPADESNSNESSMDTSSSMDSHALCDLHSTTKPDEDCPFTWKQGL